MNGDNKDGSSTPKPAFSFGQLGSSTTPAGNPPQNEPSKFQFGSGGNSGLFATSTSGNSPFGQSTTAGAGSGLFGGATTSSQQTSSTPATAAGGMFGSNSNSTAFSLSNTTDKSKENSATAFSGFNPSGGATGAFGKPSGNDSQSSFSFGGAKTDQKENSNQQTGLFGSGSNAPSLFSKNDATSSAPSFSLTPATSNENKSEAPSLFGNKALTPFGSATDKKEESTGLFGSKTTGTFGASSEKKDEPKGLFGSATTAAPSLFGQTNTAATSNTPKSLFGASAEKKDEPAKTGFSLGGLTDKKDESSKTGFSFGSTAAAEKKDDAPKTGLFGAPAASSEKRSGFSFDTNEKKPAAPVFGGGAAATAEKKDDKPSLFGGAAAATEKKDDKPSLFGGATTSEKKEDKSLFGGAQVNSSDKKETAKEVAASIKDIAPSAYLKNKSFEDIIAKWTSALAKNSTEFETQAEDIASWDRVLVENGEKIGELFNQVVLAEQSQGKIDQMLQYIGRQQDDLEGLLDSYEKQASEFLSNLSGPEGLQPVDQEREKAYRLAEDLNEKLENLGGNLSSVVDEINKVSTDLNHSKEDDALTQIVKILNSHLSSLQWIDTNTTHLQEKLEQIHMLETQTRDHVDSAGDSFRRYR